MLSSWNNHIVIQCPVLLDLWFDISGDQRWWLLIISDHRWFADVVISDNQLWSALMLSSALISDEDSWWRRQRWLPLMTADSVINAAADDRWWRRQHWWPLMASSVLISANQLRSALMVSSAMMTADGVISADYRWWCRSSADYRWWPRIASSTLRPLMASSALITADGVWSRCSADYRWWPRIKSSTLMTADGVFVTDDRWRRRQRWSALHWWLLMASSALITTDDRG